MSSKEFDTIVIGAGVSGLSCAAHLAKAGKKVVVFEQNKRPGGYCCSYVRKGLVFDPGAHWIIDGDSFNNLLQEFGVDPIEFVQLKAVYRILGPTKYVDILMSERNLFEKSVRRSFPNIKDSALNQLIDLSQLLMEEMSQMPTDSPELVSLFSKISMGVKILTKAKNMKKYSTMKLHDLLLELFPGEEYKDLRAALHIVPGEDATAIALLVFIALGMSGSAYGPKGGAQKIPDALAKAVKKNGGKIVYSKRIKKIKLEENKVSGVVLDDKSEYLATTVVAALDAKQLYYQLLDPLLLPKKLKKRLEETPIADSWFSVSLVTDLDPADYDFDGSDVLFLNTNNIVEAGIPNNPEINAFVGKFNTLHDESFRLSKAKDNHHGIHLLAPATLDYENFWKAGPKLNRGKRYESFKTKYAQTLVKRLEERIPKLSDHIVDMDISTPLTYHRYTLNHGGSGLGWQDMILWKQKISFIKGLYHCGMWSFPGPMVEPSISSGKNAAELVLKKLNK
ncbi:MAG: NAD(P)/FAD-dependent oxidoreductase [Candidatus Heimdallarchaeota archaeon]